MLATEKMSGYIKLISPPLCAADDTDLKKLSHNLQESERF